MSRFGIFDVLHLLVHSRIHADAVAFSRASTNACAGAQAYFCVGALGFGWTSHRATADTIKLKTDTIILTA